MVANLSQMRHNFENIGESAEKLYHLPYHADL